MATIGETPTLKVVDFIKSPIESAKKGLQALIDKALAGLQKIFESEVIIPALIWAIPKIFPDSGNKPGLKELVEAVKERMDAGVDVRILLRNEGDTRLMLQALVAGERDTQQLASLAKGRLKEKRAQLVEALSGRLQPHQSFLIAEHLAQEGAPERGRAARAEDVRDQRLLVRRAAAPDQEGPGAPLQEGVATAILPGGIGCLRRLDPMHDVEHDHALVERHRVLDECACGGVAAPDLHADVAQCVSPAATTT